MDYFLYKNNELYAEDCAVRDIVAKVGTPVYIYSANTIRRHVEVFRDALKQVDLQIFFAVKSNSNQAVLTLLAKMGVGMDVVSIGEYRRARMAGVPGEKIVFSGVGKKRSEIREILHEGIYQFNVESEAELKVLSEEASALGLAVPIALRVNPDVDAKTHAKISTGKAENKFGIPYARAADVYNFAASLPGIDVAAIDMHIGSQLTELEPFEQAFLKMRTLYDELTSAGHDIRRLDLGGGLGVPYTRDNRPPPLPYDYGKIVEKTLGDLDCEIAIEPGRLISGNAGILVTEVIYVKEGTDRNFLIVDAAMNDLLRPAMYDAFHEIETVIEPRAPKDAVYDVVGPVCETGDVFAKNVELPTLQADDLIAFRTAGAYGAVMASEYNSRPLVPEVLVDKDQYAIIRKRPTIEEMIAKDDVPDWL